MPRSNQNIELHSGDDFEIGVTVRNEQGAILNITSYTFTWKVFDRSGAAVITKTSASGISITDPLNGKLKITLSPTDTASYTGRYSHELEGLSPANRRSTLMTGRLKINEDLVV